MTDMTTEQCWSVWVGGGTVNDCYLTRQQAEVLADYWVDRGYDDVVVTVEM